MAEPTTTDLWRKLERSADAWTAAIGDPPTAPEPSEASDTDGARRRKQRRARRWLDMVASLFWVYALCKIFLADFDRSILGALNPGWAHLVDYRAFAYLGILIILAIVAKMAWAYLLYVVFFPFILLGWKIPRQIWRRKSWIVVVAIVHAASSTFTNFRFNFASKGIAVFAIYLACASGRWYVTAPCCIYLIALTALSFGRAIVDSFRRSQFLVRQDQLINWLMNRSLFDIDQVAHDLQAREVEIFQKADIDKFTTTLNLSLATNRALYFWAYQLEQYRQTPASLVFAAARYAMLFLGTTLTLMSVNLAIYHWAPAQFAYSAPPSILNMLLFSMSSLALNAGGGVEAVGGLATIVRLGAGFGGVVLFLTLAANILVSYRRDQDASAIRSTVRELKRRAREHERHLEDTLDVTFDEAIRRLDRLGANLTGLLAALLRHIPSDFYGEDGPMPQADT